jgi:ABC-type sugar transport system ATPase subunit
MIDERLPFLDDMPMLALHELRKRYPHAGSDALAPLTLTLADNERLILLGPSGSGKSTILRLIAGLESPTCGTITFDGRELNAVPPHQRNVGLLPQRPVLYPHLRVRDHISHEASQQLHVGHLLDRYPHELSGGELQRVALARLIGQNRRILLLDEPFAPLDPAFRAEFRHDLHLLLTRFPATMLVVTHDPSDAHALGGRVGVMGDGRLQQLGSAAELIRQPINRFVAITLGHWTVFDGRVEQSLPDRVGGGDSASWCFTLADGSARLTLPDSFRQMFSRQPTSNLALGIRLDDVVFQSQSREVLTGRDWPLISAEPVGSGCVLTLALGRNRLKAVWPSSTPPRFGEPVTWHLSLTNAAWFNHVGQRVSFD